MVGRRSKALTVQSPSQEQQREFLALREEVWRWGNVYGDGRVMAIHAFHAAPGRALACYRAIFASLQLGTRVPSL